MKLNHLLPVLMLLAYLGVLNAAPTNVSTVDPNVTITSESAGAVVLEFAPARYENKTETSDGDQFQLTLISDEGTTYDYGKPVLPAISRWVVVPPTAGLELVITADPPRRETAGYKPLLCTEGDPTAVSTLTGSDGIYPNVIAAMGEPIILRGVRMVLVTTYPVRYDASTNSYLYYDRIQTELRFTEGEPVNPAELPVRRNRSPHFLKTLDQLVVNPENIGRDDPDHPQEYVGHYLIVIHDSLLQYVSPFVEWRRKSGWKVEILSVADGASYATVKAQVQARYDAYLDAGQDPFDHIFLIGDRTSHDNSGAPVGYILNAHAGTSRWGGASHADYKYGLLEGNDDLPDVAISRWAAGSKSLMELNIGKTLGYEATPRMENPEWFSRGGVISTHYGNSETSSWHVLLHTNVRWGTEVLRKAGFTDIVSYEDYAWDQLAQRLHPVICKLYNDGSSLILANAQLYNWRNDAHGINRNDVHPIDISLGTQSQFATWWITRTGHGDSLIGPVARTFSWGYPDIGPMNAIWLSMVNGVAQNDLTLGWGRTYTLANVAKFYGNNLNVQYLGTDFDIMGDPALQPWKGVPRQVNLTHPDFVTPKTRIIELTVTDRDAGTPVSGATVTVYAPGNMPAFNSPDYAQYDDMQMWIATSNADGTARFVFPDDVQFTADTDFFFTVTGKGICPLARQCRVMNLINAEINSYELVELEGNRDGIINPGELFELSIEALNISEMGDINDVRAVVTSLSDYVVIEEGDIDFGDLRAQEPVWGDSTVVIRIDSACPDGISRPVTQPSLLVEFISGDSRWRSAIRLMVHSPNLEVKPGEGEIIVQQDGGAHELDIELTNIGTIATGEQIRAILFPLSFGVKIGNRQALYEQIEPGASKNIIMPKFRATASQEVPPGYIAPMLLVLSSENGWSDSAFFNLQLGETGANKPGLPDKYGYSAYDDTDIGWKRTPVFDWIEISPKENDRRYEGVSCGFDGKPDDPKGYNAGQTKVVPLGFTTRFYGYEYDSISICSNGFISMGNQPKITNYQNWHMDQAIGGGVGMIAPFWDKLKLDSTRGNVFYYYDEDSARFVIEWYNLRHYTDGAEYLIFQVVLYDIMRWSVAGSDTPILMQYKSIKNDINIGGGGAGASEDKKWMSDNPYASVGISSPDGNSGINYCFGNSYPETSAKVENGRALLFSTSQKNSIGILYGTVTDEETGESINGAELFSSLGQLVLTDENGDYRITEAVAELAFNLTASAKGYNSRTERQLIVSEGDSLRTNFALLHPEFGATQALFEAVIGPDSETEIDFSVVNNGNGPLEWKLYRKLQDDAHVSKWNRRETLLIGAALGTTRVQGAVIADGKYVVSAGARTAQDENMIYILDRDLVLLDSFPQFGVSRLGMYDLGWDGELVWGADNSILYGFTLSGEIIKQFDTDVDYIRGVEWDAVRGQIIISGRTTTAHLMGYDRDGNLLNDYGTVGYNRVGLGFWGTDPDGYQLYIFYDDIDGALGVAKTNLRTKESVPVVKLTPPEGGLAEGCFITDEFDQYGAVLITIVNGVDINIQYNDRMDIWQLARRRDWFKVVSAENPIEEVSAGTTLAGERTDLGLVLNSTALAHGMYTGFLQFVHNAMTETDTLTIELEVKFEGVSPQPGEDVSAQQPVVFGLNAIYPSPFNSVTTIRYGADRAEQMSIRVFDVNGRLVTTLTDAPVKIGNHSLVWNASGVSSGVYVIRLESGGRVRTAKTVLVR